MKEDGPSPPPALARHLPREGRGMAEAHPFPTLARRTLEDTQLRRNLRVATGTIRGKRAAAVDEIPDWEELREAGAALKDHVLRHLDR
jgi:L-lactate utilization protein LutB